MLLTSSFTTALTAYNTFPGSMHTSPLHFFCYTTWPWLLQFSRSVSAAAFFYHGKLYLSICSVELPAGRVYSCYEYIKSIIIYKRGVTWELPTSDENHKWSVQYTMIYAVPSHCFSHCPAILVEGREMKKSEDRWYATFPQVRSSTIQSTRSEHIKLTWQVIATQERLLDLPDTTNFVLWCFPHLTQWQLKKAA